MCIVVHIGFIVGVFDSEEKVRSIAEKCERKYNCREGEKHYFDVFPMPESNKINEEYLEG